MTGGPAAGESSPGELIDQAQQGGGASGQATKPKARQQKARRGEAGQAEEEVLGSASVSPGAQYSTVTKSIQFRRTGGNTEWKAFTVIGRSEVRIGFDGGGKPGTHLLQ